MQAQGGQAGEVDGAGSGEDVGQVAFLAAAAGFSPAPGPAGELADLALHDGPVLPVGLLPGGIRRALVCWRAASWGWILITRPRRALVHSARSGHEPHSAPKRAAR
jgi:hypothetical protein